MGGGGRGGVNFNPTNRGWAWGGGGRFSYVINDRSTTGVV